MIDSELAREIRRENGDGSREAKFAFLRKIRAAAAQLSTPKAREEFTAALRQHGRAAVAICVAATLYARRERIDGWELTWAMAVLALWTNRPREYISAAYIDDGLHPTRICEYAGSFIRATKEEP